MFRWRWRTFTLALTLCVGCAVLGHFLAQRAVAIPRYGDCPILPNTNCPACFTVTVLGVDFPCDNTGFGGSWKSCVDGGSNLCANSGYFTCSGYVNSQNDCSGITDTTNPCSNGDFRRCLN
jgi:hypothetical protein